MVRRVAASDLLLPIDRCWIQKLVAAGCLELVDCGKEGVAFANGLGHSLTEFSQALIEVGW
jgi:hypothetical protein